VLNLIKADLAKLSTESREEAEVYVDAVEKQTRLAKPNAGFIVTGWPTPSPRR
jgi:hypothetical protein